MNTLRVRIAELIFRNEIASHRNIQFSVKMSTLRVQIAELIFRNEIASHRNIQFSVKMSTLRVQIAELILILTFILFGIYYVVAGTRSPSAASVEQRKDSYMYLLTSYCISSYLLASQPY